MEGHEGAGVRALQARHRRPRSLRPRRCPWLAPLPRVSRALPLSSPSSPLRSGFLARLGQCDCRPLKPDVTDNDELTLDTSSNGWTANPRSPPTSLLAEKARLYPAAPARAPEQFW
jgi:hypothetical protein